MTASLIDPVVGLSIAWAVWQSEQIAARGFELFITSVPCTEVKYWSFCSAWQVAHMPGIDWRHSMRVFATFWCGTWAKD